MDIAQVKMFIHRESLLDKVYFARDIQTLFDNCKYAKDYIALWGVLDTPNGDTLFEIDCSYSGEPILLRRFMHIDSFLKFNNNCELIAFDASANKMVQKYLDEREQILNEIKELNLNL